MNRRGFLMGLGGILASAAASAIVRADSLMRIVPRDTLLICTPEAAKLYGAALFKGELGRYEGIILIDQMRHLDRRRFPVDTDGVWARAAAKVIVNG